MFAGTFIVVLLIELVKIIFTPTPAQPLPGLEGLKEMWIAVSLRLRAM
jgi:hypothetical protein